MTTPIRCFLVAPLVLGLFVICVPAAEAQQQADLSISKVGPAQAAAGSDVTYTIDVFNNGPDNSVTATLVDRLPDGVTFVSVTPPASTDWTCGAPSTDPTTHIVTVTCNTPTGVPVGADHRFSFVLNLDSGTPPGTTVTNSVRVSTPPDMTNGATDPNDENNTAFASTTVPGGDRADLAVTKTADFGQALADSDVTYTIQVKNNGPDPSTDAELRDTLPADMTFVRLDQTFGPIWTCSVPMAGAGGTISCTNSNLPAGSNGNSTFMLVGHIPPGESPGTSYGNQAVVSSSLDPDLENNSSYASTTVVTTAPSLSTTASGPIVFGGSISDTANLSGGSNATGTITFYVYGPDNTNCSGDVSFPPSSANVSGDGAYNSAPFTPVAAGTYRFVAVYSGDDNNKGVANTCGDPSESVVVSKANTTTNVTSSVNPSTFGQSVTFTATVTPAASAPATPGGTVQFLIDGSNFGGPVSMSGGTAQTSTSSLTVGNHSVTAQYSGDGNFKGSSGTLSGGQTVNPAPTPTPTATPSPTATPTPTPAQALNISTRVRVDIGDRVMIGGFIITGNASKSVVLRGLGPSLANAGVPAATVLKDPFLELHGPDGALITMNDNWKDSPQRSQIEGTLFQPTDDNEAVILATLTPGNYTAVISGVDQTAGVGLIEVYDNDQAADSVLANISTRGFVQTADNVMIGGFILGGNNNPSRVAVRALGPSLTGSGLNNVLADPTLELHNANGTVMISNDDWQSDPVSAGQLSANGLALPDPKESGIFALLPPGQFTAILAGKEGTVGIGLVEIYNVK